MEVPSPAPQQHIFQKYVSSLARGPFPLPPPRSVSQR